MLFFVLFVVFFLKYVENSNVLWQ